ncbi:thiosulfate oxidation carrier complex protein SoxZ [Massilia sp. W12]|uniref:thiosulfate oxidation carrier complex protein SoxZ n=1 Tax=Massilia sp. W12 TaxID=3126507 RepID=UPI0030D39BCE
MAAEPMRIRAIQQGAHTEVKILMRHDMETGQRKEADGKLVPAHFIQQVQVQHNNKTVLNAMFGPSVSKDPYLSFKFNGGAKGESVRVQWRDNRGESRSDEVQIA